MFKFYLQRQLSLGMTAYLKFRPRSKKRTIWTCILSVVLLICMYNGIFHLHHYQRYVVFPILTSISVVCVTQLLDLWLEPIKIQFFKPLTILCTMILVWLGAQLTLNLQSVYLSHELTEYGVLADARVEEVVSSASFLKPKHALISYKFNGKTWIQKVDNDNDIYQKNDVLKIKLASQEPDIIQILKVTKNDSRAN